MVSIAQGWRRLRTFWSEVKSEVKKVTFPSRDEVIATTVVVLVASVIFASFLWVSDIVIRQVYGAIFRVLG
ncbi:MAG: preprotein translocase subunit SecE [Thermoanaerobaculia bacterium]